MLRMIEDKTYDEITRHSNYVLENNWQKQRQAILSNVSKHDQSYLDEANAMQVRVEFFGKKQESIIIFQLD